MKHEIWLDVLYLQARVLKGLDITPEHQQLVDREEPTMIAKMVENLGSDDMHYLQIMAHANTQDEDTERRDNIWYPNNRLHPQEA